MSLLREVKSDNAELRKDNDALKSRIRALETEVDQLRHEWDTEREDWRQQCAAFSLERAGWQHEIHLLKRDKELLESQINTGGGE